MTNGYEKQNKDQIDINADFNNWKIFLNNGIGLVSFNLAIGCLGTTTPSLNAFLSLIAISILYCLGYPAFVKSLRDLRRSSKDNEFAKEIVRGIERTKLTPKILLAQYTLFLFGFFFLVFVFALPETIKYFPRFEVFIK